VGTWAGKDSIKRFVMAGEDIKSSSNTSGIGW